MTCWHCNGSSLCLCITCNETGECQACKGIARWNKLRPLLEHIDIRERRYWTLVKPEAPAHPFRRLNLEVIHEL